MQEVRKIISVKEGGESEDTANFKTSLFGFDKKAVKEFIAAAEAAQRAAAEAYESKLAEQSASLSMALRERDKLSDEIAQLSEKLKILSADTDEKQSGLSAENYILKARIADLSEVERKNGELLSEINDLKSRCESRELENRELERALGEKEEVILEQCRKYSDIEKGLKLEIERIKTESESALRLAQRRGELARDNILKALNVLDHV